MIRGPALASRPPTSDDYEYENIDSTNSITHTTAGDPIEEGKSYMVYLYSINSVGLSNVD